MKKNKLIKSIIATTLGLIMALTIIPTNLKNLFAFGAKDPYETPSTIDIGGSFEDNQTSSPDKWTYSGEFDNDKDDDSTSTSGVISSDLTGWDTTYTTWLENWLENFKTTHKLDITEDADMAKVISALKTDLPKTNSPLIPNYQMNSASNGFKILKLSAGKTYSKYLNDTKTDAELISAIRKGYIAYTSNDFKLDSYSFYKITVFVKTTDNGTASIYVGGDLDKSAFDAIESSGETLKTYYFYSFSNGSSDTVSFISETEPTATTLTYNGDVYNLDADGTFKIDTTQENYTSDKANYTISFKNKQETASFSDWKQYSIYISTTTETSINLSLALGTKNNKSEGNAYFDDVKVEKIRLLDFVNNAINSSNTVVFDNREITTPRNTNSRNYTTIEDFETAHDWTLVNAPLDDTDISMVEEPLTTGYVETFKNNNPTGVNKILKVNNHNSTSVVLKSADIDISKLRYYRLSLYVQSTTDTPIEVKLIGKNASGSDVESKNSSSAYITKEEGSTSLTNFWVAYVFYIEAPALKDTTARLEITVGENSITYFDNLVIENVTKSEYSDTKDSKITLNTSIKDPIIENGNFSSYENVKIDEYSNPLPPANWSSVKKQDVYEFYADPTKSTVTKAFFADDLTIENDTITYDSKTYTKADGSNDYTTKDENGKILSKFTLVKEAVFSYKATKSGYVNDNYKDLVITSNIVAGILPFNTSTNILKITASSSESMTYKSSVIKLSKTSSLYLLSASIKTDENTKATLRLVDSDGKIYGSISNVSTYNTESSSSDWKLVKFYVGTGLDTKELYLEIEFVEASGTLEIKDVKGLVTSSTEVLTEKLKKTTLEMVKENISIVDLSQETFIEHSLTLNPSTNLFDPNLYKLVEIENTTAGIYGILDTTNAHADYTSITAKDKEASPYVLVIKNQAGQSTKLESIKKFAVESKKYLKITILAKATGIEEGKFASINFGSLNTTFNITNSEDYTEYTIYVDNSNGSETASIDYNFELLNSAGTLVIDSIKIESPENLDSAKSSYPDGDTDTVKFVKLNSTDSSDDTKKDELTTEDKSNTLEIFLAVFSSILLVGAIVFALVYTRLKAKIKPRKKPEQNKVDDTNDGEKGFI